MLIDCPSCSRSYHVSRSEIEGGRAVICPRCDAHWFVDSDGIETPLEPAAGDLRGAAVNTRVPPVCYAGPPGFGAKPAWPRHLPSVVAAVACIAIFMGMIGARERVVRLLPRLAAIYAAAGMQVNVRGLEFVGVAPTRLDPSSPEVTIAGEIRNVAQRRVVIPRVAYEVRDAAGQALMAWSERPPAAMLKAARVLSFASIPHHIPPEGRSVIVSFETDDAPVVLREAAYHPR